MSKSEGWIKLHRKLTSSNMYNNLTSTQRDVMIQCLLLANHQKNQWQWGSIIYTCEEGQFITSLDSLKNKCAKNVTVRNVRTSLLKLETWGFLTNKSTKTGRMITICKWATYQNGFDCDDKAISKEPTKSRQSTDKDVTTNNNVKNVKNDKKKDIVHLWFEEIWCMYPKKLGKKDAVKSFNKTVLTERDYEDIKKAINNYNNNLPKDDQFIMHGSTWFNNWKDWVEYKGKETYAPGIRVL